MTKEELMRKAIELSIENVANGGGPFGAVIAKDGEIIATGANPAPQDALPSHFVGSRGHARSTRPSTRPSAQTGPSAKRPESYFPPYVSSFR